MPGNLWPTVHTLIAATYSYACHPVLLMHLVAPCKEVVQREVEVFVRYSNLDEILARRPLHHIYCSGTCDICTPSTREWYPSGMHAADTDAGEHACDVAGVQPGLLTIHSVCSPRPCRL
jgi:hypothetical protein